MGIYVHFERGRHDTDGPTFGPFEFVQMTYSALRIGPVGDEIAFHNLATDDWGLWDDAARDELTEPYSDVILYDGEPPKDVTVYRSVSEWAHTDECKQREAERMWEAWDAEV